MKFPTIDAVNQYFDTDEIECLECGKSFKGLGAHLSTHKITIREYKEKYGIPFSRGLVGKATSQAMSDNMVARIIRDPAAQLNSLAKAQAMPHVNHNHGFHTAFTRINQQEIARMAQASPNAIHNTTAGKTEEVFCTNCGKIFVTPMMAAITRHKNLICKKCSNERHQAWKLKNPEKVKQYQQNTRKNKL